MTKERKGPVNVRSSLARYNLQSGGHIAVSGDGSLGGIIKVIDTLKKINVHSQNSGLFFKNDHR